MDEAPSRETLDYRDIANSSGDWESLLAPAGRPVWLSPSVAHVTGYSLGECLEMPDYPAMPSHAESVPMPPKV